MRLRGLRLRDAAVLLGGLLAIAATVAIFRTIPGIVPTTVGLALLVVVLATATSGRRWIACVVAVVATGAFNFYFFPPIGTFTIADPQNWIAVISFLVAAVITSNLSAAAQARARDAVARRNEVTRLFDLTRDVLLTTEAAGAIDLLARHVARRFELSRIAIVLPAEDACTREASRKSASTWTFSARRSPKRAARSSSMRINELMGAIFAQ